MEFAVRICLLASGIWWGRLFHHEFPAFEVTTAVACRPRRPALYFAGFRELKTTVNELIRLQQTLKFLIAYLLYNDGIQTVITASSVFLSQELFVARGIPTDRTVLVIAFLIAQIVAFVGAMMFERIAHFTSTKTAIITSLLIWSFIVIYAYGFLSTVTQAYVMSGLIGFVLGGSQALSRSLFSQMIPAGRESAFFGIYEISERGTSWIGPIIFGLVAQLTKLIQPGNPCVDRLFCWRQHYTFLHKYEPSDSGRRKSGSGRYTGDVSILPLKVGWI